MRPGRYGRRPWRTTGRTPTGGSPRSSQSRRSAVWKYRSSSEITTTNLRAFRSLGRIPDRKIPCRHGPDRSPIRRRRKPADPRRQPSSSAIRARSPEVRGVELVLEAGSVSIRRRQLQSRGEPIQFAAQVIELQIGDAFEQAKVGEHDREFSAIPVQVVLVHADAVELNGPPGWG